MPVNQRVAGSNPALAATYGPRASPSPTVACSTSACKLRQALPTTASIAVVGSASEIQYKRTASEGLAQGPYMVARVGFEPATLRMEGIALTTDPPCPTIELNHVLYKVLKRFL